MKKYLFFDTKNFDNGGSYSKDIFHTLEKVAQNTNTEDLVVAIFLTSENDKYRGTAYVRKWMVPEDFIAVRGKWSFIQKWDLPKDLPDRYKLIRLSLNANQNNYPKNEIDVYGWQFSYDTFLDHIALLFSHELHHFRRYHLNLHPREGEQSANKWALSHVQNLGFHVSGKRLPNRKFRARLTVYYKPNPFIKFRKLTQGSKLVITHDPKNRYLYQTAILIRPVRSNSKRVVIETNDGKKWRWPMQWVKPSS